MEGRKAVVRTEIHRGRYIVFAENLYEDTAVDPPVWRKYETADRSGRNPKDGGPHNRVDGVTIIAIVHREKATAETADGGGDDAVPQWPCVVVVEQYRGSVNGTCVEFPSGCVEGDENPRDAAIRELAEETGFVVGTRFGPQPRMTSPTMYADPSISSDSVKAYVVDIDGDDPRNADNARMQRLDEGEHVTVRLIPVSRLLRECEDYAARNYAVDAFIYQFALGLSMAPKLLPGGHTMKV